MVALIKSSSLLLLEIPLDLQTTFLKKKKWKLQEAEFSSRDQGYWK